VKRARLHIRNRRSFHKESIKIPRFRISSSWNPPSPKRPEIKAYRHPAPAAIWSPQSCLMWWLSSPHACPYIARRVFN